MKENYFIELLNGDLATALANSLALITAATWIIRNRRTILANAVFLFLNGPKRLIRKFHRSEFLIARPISKDIILFEAYNSRYYAQSFVDILLYISSMTLIGTLLNSASTDIKIAKYLTHALAIYVKDLGPNDTNILELSRLKQLSKFLLSNSSEIDISLQIPFIFMIGFTTLVASNHVIHKRIMSKAIRLRRRALKLASKENVDHA